MVRDTAHPTRNASALTRALVVLRRNRKTTIVLGDRLAIRPRTRRGRIRLTDALPAWARSRIGYGCCAGKGADHFGACVLSPRRSKHGPATSRLIRPG